MQQPTGHYASGSVYPSGPPSDAPYPYAHMASYGSAPPYTSSPSYYADNVAHQPNAQAPPYVPSQQSLADSMASLSMSPQGLYATAALPQGSYATPAPIHAPAQASVSYAPTVPFYEQSYGAGAATPSQNPSHQQSLPSQPLSYVPAGFADVPPYPQAGYDPLPSSHMGSYHSNPPSTYEPPPSLMGSYETNQQISAAKAGYSSSVTGVGSGYSSSSSGTQPYGATQQGMQGYDYSNSGQLGVYDQGGGMYGPLSQGREYERPVYSPVPAYDTTYYNKPAGHDRGPVKNAHDFDDVGLGEVYAYDGGNVEPYGARGTGTGGSWAGLESYGSGSFSSYGSSGTSKIPKAIPKVETEDKNSGVQKYRVKMLSDASSNGPQNVLCQIGLDGVRMISPTTNKTVRIYPLETITRWEVNEPSVFTFWAKSAVDPEPRRIRLQSGSYTTNAILDTLTAACVQFSEMVGKVDVTKASADADKNVDQNSEKKKPAFVNWVPLRNRQLAPEEKQHWVPDEAVTKCSGCSSDFGPFLRRKKLALRVLSQDVSTGPAERNWSTWALFHTKKRNRLTTGQLERLVFCHCNLKLLEQGGHSITPIQVNVDKVDIAKVKEISQIPAEERDIYSMLFRESQRLIRQTRSRTRRTAVSQPSASTQHVQDASSSRGRGGATRCTVRRGRGRGRGRGIDTEGLDDAGLHASRDDILGAAAVALVAEFGSDSDETEVSSSWSSPASCSSEDHDDDDDDVGLDSHT